MGGPHFKLAAAGRYFGPHGCKSGRQTVQMDRKAMPRVHVVPITQLILDERNANKGTKLGRELLAKSLGNYGAGRSVVVDSHNRVIAGNKTVEAARDAGMQSITVVETDGSSLVAVQRGDWISARTRRLET
jgi:hypothetical protein